MEMKKQRQIHFYPDLSERHFIFTNLCISDYILLMLGELFIEKSNDLEIAFADQYIMQMTRPRIIWLMCTNAPSFCDGVLIESLP